MQRRQPDDVSRYANHGPDRIARKMPAKRCGMGLFVHQSGLDGFPVAEELVHAVLADHPHERTISLLAISVSHLEEHSGLQLDLPLGLEDEKRRPGTKIGIARWMADRAVDVIRDRFGWHSIGYGSVALELSRSVPDEFRELAEKDL
jgi:hypothetical protein